MANSNGNAEILVEHAPVIAHIQCVTNPDGSFKFQFLSTTVVNGRKCGRFSWHPDLLDEVKRFCRRHNILRKHFKNQPRDSKAPLLPPDFG